MAPECLPDCAREVEPPLFQPGRCTELGESRVANLAFTPIQFGLRNLPLASVDILIVWATIVWMMAAVARRAGWLAALQLPYLAWVSTATVLQLSITWMNR
jgi:tryptophan-rich sensory protein